MCVCVCACLGAVGAFDQSPLHMYQPASQPVRLSSITRLARTIRLLLNGIIAYL